MEENRHWYVIHTYSGYENKVKANLENKVHSLGMEDKIFQVMIPMRDEVVIKDNRKEIVSRKVFPGYVLIEMIVTDKTWYAVRNTPGVTGFVGSGTNPIPLSEAEVKHIMGDAESGTQGVVNTVARPKIDVSLHQEVRIVGDSGFAGRTGSVAEINEERGTLKVLVEVFGRATPVEVNYSEIEVLK